MSTASTREAPDEVTTSGRTRPGAVLALLFLATFALGYSEELVVGVLDLLAADLQVPVPAAGGLVTAYALGLAAGGPILTALTIRSNRRSVLLAALAVFLVATVLPLVVDDLSLFYVARSAAGAAAGLFIAAALITATAIVPAERAGQALSVVIAGFMVATAFGVPLGTLVGQVFGWRGAFAAVLALAVPVAVAIAVAVPAVPGTGAAAAGQARFAFAPRVLAVLGLMVLVFTAISAAFTYIVPFLRDVTGVSGPLVSVFLLAYGAATAVGSFAGGRFADRAAARTIVGATVGLVAGLVALHLVGASAPLVIGSLLIWGVFAAGMIPSLQYRIVELAGPGGELAASLPASAANAGIALGAVAGGVALGPFGPLGAVLTGLVIAILAVPVAWVTGRIRPPAAATSPDTPRESSSPSAVGAARPRRDRIATSAGVGTAHLSTDR